MGTILFMLLGVSVEASSRINVNGEFIINEVFFVCDISKKQNILTNTTCHSVDTSCDLFLSQLQIIKTLPDTFTKLSEDVIVYSDVGEVSYVDCEKINSIKVTGLTINTDKCMKLLPVETPNQTAAFLRKDGFLVKQHIEVECPVQDEHFVIGNTELTLSGIYYTSLDFFLFLCKIYCSLFRFNNHKKETR
jgi:hypothetical protein